MRTLSETQGPFPRWLPTAQGGLLAVQQCHISVMGTFADALRSVFKPLSCDSSQNFEEVFYTVAADECENQPNKRK